MPDKIQIFKKMKRIRQSRSGPEWICWCYDTVIVVKPVFTSDQSPACDSAFLIFYENVPALFPLY